MRFSLRLRLLAFSGLFVALALAFLWVLLAAMFERQIAREYEARLSAVIDTLAANLVETGEGWKLERVPVDPRYGLPGSGEYWQVSGALAAPIRSRSLWDTTFPQSGSPTVKGAPLVTLTGPAGEAVLALVSDISIGEEGSLAGFRLIAATRKAAFDDAVAAFGSQMVVMLAIAGLALTAASALQVTVGIAPLLALSRQVADIRSGVARRLGESGPSETGALVHEVNQLLEARERDLEKARNRATDLAHGLKTPLTILSQIAETAGRRGSRQLGGEIGEQVDSIRQKVDRQLALARMSSLHGARTDIREATERLIAVVRRLPTRERIEWRNQTAPGIEVACEFADFAEAMGNVLDNARKFAHSRIEVSAQVRGRDVAISIADDGPGVAPQDIGRMLERGGRLDAKASETGLGLAITGEIVDAHGGGLSVTNRPGGGLVVSLTLPKAGQPA